MNRHPNCSGAIAVSLSACIAVEGIAVGAQDFCWPKPSSVLACNITEHALLHTEFPNHLPVSLSPALVLTIASTGTTQMPAYA